MIACNNTSVIGLNDDQFQGFVYDVLESERED